MRDCDNILIEMGDKVYWNDPALKSLETLEERQEHYATLWEVTAFDRGNETILITNEYGGEAEVNPQELEVAIIPRHKEDYVD